jgi:hypothetical protein
MTESIPIYAISKPLKLAMICSSSYLAVSPLNTLQFMKNVKLALSAIAVLVVVGGALAFKAHKSGVSIYSCSAQYGVCLYAGTVGGASVHNVGGWTKLPNTGLQPGTGESCADDNCNTPLWVEEE